MDGEFRENMMGTMMMMSNSWAVIKALGEKNYFLQEVE